MDEIKNMIQTAIVMHDERKFKILKEAKIKGFNFVLFGKQTIINNKSILEFKEANHIDEFSSLEGELFDLKNIIILEK